MAAYFMKSTAACALWMLAITTTTWSDTSGEKTKKCNINEWYLKKTGEGLFSAELTEKQKTIKSEIEDLIQKSSNDKSLSKVDCSVLETYESKLTNTDSSDTDTVDEDSDADDEELDETEMMDDETDEDELDSCDGDDEIDDDSPETDDDSDETSEENMTLEEDNASKSDKRTSAKSPSVVWNCLKQKPNRTSRSCVLLNVFSKRCSLFELPDQKEAQADAPDDVKTGSFRDSKTQRDSVSEREATTKTKPTDATDKKSRRIDSSRKEKNKDSVRTKGQLKDSREEATTGGKSADTTNKKSRSDDLNKKQKEKETSNAKQQQKDSLQKDDQQTATSSPPDESSSKQTGESSTESDADSNAEKLNRGDSGANGFDVNQFQELIEKTAGEYMMKIQSLETQIMRLENDLLVEKLNKQNHSSSFTRLENQILKLENELLKMNLSYEELKEENENIMKKQKSFLELDYVKRPGDRARLPDNSTKHIEMISQHQNKISELTDHLRNQTLLIDKIRGQSDSLEDQNRVLFQIVMNQTMLISQMMKKVESLTDSNLKHHMQQKLLHDRLDIALASNHALEDLQAIVSDAFPTEAKGASSSEGSDGGMKRKTPQTLSLSRCKHPSRNKVTCRFSSTVLNQCLWNENDTVTVPSKFQQLERKQDKPVPVDKKTKDLKSTEAPKDESVKSRPKEAPNKKESTKQRSTEKQDKTGGKRAGSEKSKKAEQASKESDPKVSKPSEEEKDSKKVSSKDEVKKTAEKEKVKISEESKTESKDPKASAEEEKKAQKPDKEEVDKEETKHTASKDMESDERKSVKSDMPKSNDKKTDIQTDDPRSKDRKQVAEKKKPESKQKEKTSTAKSETKDTKDSKELKPKTGGEKDKGSTSKKTKKSGQGERKVERIPPLYNATKQLDPKDCMGHYRPNKRDGQYKIKLHDRGKTLSVFCDMKNGGWTVIQRRQDGTVNFFKSWQEYKVGFGGIYGEHWLGNDNIHRLTNQDQYELRVDLMDWNRSKKFALYDYVRVDSEEDGYRLHVEGYSGDAGDGLSKHNGEKFSTKDRDNDRLVKEFNGSCANRFKGAWWYYKCYASNLNGKYYKNGNIPEKLFDGITWKPWTGPSISLRKVEIKIRPIQPKN